MEFMESSNLFFASNFHDKKFNFYLFIYFASSQTGSIWKPKQLAFFNLTLSLKWRAPRGCVSAIKFIQIMPLNIPTSHYIFFGLNINLDPVYFVRVLSKSPF